MSQDKTPCLDFDAIDRQLSQDIEGNLNNWLSDKKIKKSGDWFAIGTHGSLKVHSSDGHWTSHETGDKGPGLLSLYAWRNGKPIKEVAADFADADLPPITRQPEPPLPTHPNGEPSKVYDYRDENGRLQGAVLRWDEGDSKTFRQAALKDGTWKWEAMPEPRPLYGVENLRLKPEARVVIVEGEKAADALTNALHDVIVITWPGGSSAVNSADWKPLEGRDVTVWPDNDKPGAKAAEDIREHLPQAVILDVSELGPKEDAADVVGIWEANYLKQFVSRPPKSALMEKLKAATISDRERIDQLKKKSINDVLVLPMAMLGEATALYMTHNGGKTLFTLRFLIDSIHAGRIGGKDLFYILADDTFNGQLEKAELATDTSFNLVVPDSQEGAIKADEIPALLDDLARSGSANGKIIVIDTLKKVVGMMDKTRAADFGKVVRRFVQAGGTFISLAHVNKHSGDDGKPVYEGTGDIVNDFDCAWTGTLDTPKDEPRRQITLENIKRRSNVPNKITLTYDASKETSWRGKFESVKVLDPEEAERRARALEDKQLLDDDHLAVMWIRSQLEDGAKNTSAIKTAHCPHAGQKKVVNLLFKYGDDHRNPHLRFWTSRSAPKNAQLWTLTANHPEAYLPDPL